jgi:hypothetical protein
MNYKNKFLKLFGLLKNSHDKFNESDDSQLTKHVETDDYTKYTTTKWLKDGKIHRENKPALISYHDEEHWIKKWYKDGQIHRDNEPAVITRGGKYSYRNEWYQNGQLHRENGPAIEYENGMKHWYQNGKLHRLNGPAIESSDRESQSYQWYKEGQLHRDGGPAVYLYTANDYHEELYYKEGKLHRLDGPAKMYNNIHQTNGKVEEWWIDGVQLNSEEIIAKQQKLADKSPSLSKPRM